MVTVDPIPRPLRDVHIEYEIDNEKCINCVDKPCLNVCPIDAVYQDENTFVKMFQTLTKSSVELVVHV